MTSTAHLATNRFLQINLASQQLELRDPYRVLVSYWISSALKGPGEQNGSECTPRGSHKIRARIGGGCPIGTVFVARRPTGERYVTSLGRHYPKRDWILSRILWLSGLELGRNRLGEVDTMRRYIYIHGTPDEIPMGTPGSHGCIRMRNKDIISLYNQVLVGTKVIIE